MAAAASTLFDADLGVISPTSDGEEEFVFSVEDSGSPLIMVESEEPVTRQQVESKIEMDEDIIAPAVSKVKPLLTSDKPAMEQKKEAALDVEARKTAAEERRVSDQSDFSNTPLDPKKEVYKFQVVWDPVRKMGNLGYHIRRHILIAPYRGENHAAKHIQIEELPESSPLFAAVKACRAKGIPVITGFWKYWNNPVAILFDLDHMPQVIVDRYIAELKRDRGVDIPAFDDKCRLSIVLGYCAAEFIIQFELAISPERLSKRSWVRFHNWTAAAGALFLPQWFKPLIKITLLISRTQLVDLSPRNIDEAISMAAEARVAHRYNLELEAAQNAFQLIIPKRVSKDMIETELPKAKPTHMLVDPVPQWWAMIKGFFVKLYRKPKHRMTEKMHTSEKKAFEDLKTINIPLIRSFYVKGG